MYNLYTVYYLTFLFPYKIYSLFTCQVARQAGAYPCFCSMKQLGIFLLPLDGMLVHGKVTPSPFVHLGRERHCESKVSCTRTQHNVPGQGSNPNYSIRRRAH